jgi:transposase
MEVIPMIIVAVDVAKDKHDCFITNTDGEVLFDSFVIQNNQDGFEDLYQKICSVTGSPQNVKVGLEATGHYHLNLLGYLLDKGFPTCLINPLQTSLFRKSLSFRKTKTDPVDARAIARLLMSDRTLQPYSLTSYQNQELKSLTRYRADKVRERAKLKSSLARLVVILFPELEKLVPVLHMFTVYDLLHEFPGASYVASAHLTRLSHLISESSKGRYGKEKALEIREAARHSIGSVSPAKSLELRHTIDHIRFLDEEIDEVEAQIFTLLDKDPPRMLDIPGMGPRMAAVIVAEVGDFNRFSSPDKLLAYAGLSPSTYQSGQLTSTYAKMEKRGSRYLRCALFNATKYVCMWDPVFKAYLAKKRAEGKHYNVAISHAAKKLVRLIYHLETTGKSYRSKAA